MSEPVVSRYATLKERLRRVSPVLGILVLLALAHWWAYVPSEPFYNGDETRHVMTGVFFRDAILDLPSQPREYAVDYYLQYPALGLLVWPPLFYMIEGAFMVVAGTSFTAARVLVWLFAAWACVSLYRLVERTHGQTAAFLTTFLMGLSPQVFEYSHQVMLEVPTLAFALFAIDRCHRYMVDGRCWDLTLCCLGTAGAALCRYDAAFLAPLYLIWLIGGRQLSLLRRPAVWVAAVVAVILVAPAYLLCAREMGGSHVHSVVEGTAEDSTGLFAASNFLYYPGCIPEQFGWFALPPMLIGLISSLRATNRNVCWPYFALLGATYITFVPIAEVGSRHVIYWVPTLAFFTARGTLLLVEWMKGWPGLAVGALVLVGTLGTSLSQPVYYVRGYEEAAAYTVAQNDETSVCMMEGLLNGNFIYQSRRQDPERRLAVLRGDKVIYAVLSDPHGGYKEQARDEAEVLAVIHRYDPEYIVIEDPQIYYTMRGPELLRATLRNHPERFTLEREVVIESNHPTFKGKKLLIYRNKVRNPNRDQSVHVPMLGMGRDLHSP